MKDHCINCGHCLEVCPQNAKKFASDIDRVRGYLRQGMKVIISLAPSYLECWSMTGRGRLSRLSKSWDFMRSGRQRKGRPL